jgi:hypothetical protein
MAVKMKDFFLGAGVGAGLMYLLDPERGEQRRNLAYEKLVQRVISDPLLVGRIRSALHEVTPHASNIKITAQDGTVTLTGTVFRDDLYQLLKRVSSIKGVVSIHNNLEIHEASLAAADQ